jgi:hypothetical protein
MGFSEVFVDARRIGNTLKDQGKLFIESTLQSTDLTSAILGAAAVISMGVLFMKPELLRYTILLTPPPSSSPYLHIIQMGWLGWPELASGSIDGSPLSPTSRNS